MKKSKHFDYDAALFIEQQYVSASPFDPVFGDRIESLQRYFEFTSKFVNTYIEQSKISLSHVLENSDSAEESDVHEIMTSGDSDYFMEYLRASVLSHLFTLMEGLLSDVANEVAKMLGQQVELPENMPYINRFITYLQRSCGLAIKIDKETWKKIDMLRSLRNKYVHQMNRDLPEHIQQQLQKLIDEAQEPGGIVDDIYVRSAFKTIGSLAEIIDLAYWAFVDTHNASNK